MIPRRRAVPSGVYSQPWQQGHNGLAALWAARQKSSESGWLPFRILRGGARNAQDFLYGAPGAVKLGGRVIGGEFAGLYATTPGIGRHLPGSAGALRFSNRTRDEAKQAAHGMVSDLRRTWGPGGGAIIGLVKGDFDRTGRDLKKLGGNFVQDPLFMTLDAMGGWGAAGKAAGATSRGAMKLGAGKPGGRLDRWGARGAEHEALRRDPFVVERRVHDEFAADGSRLVVARPNMSRNPLTRELVQRPITGPLRAKLAPSIRSGFDALAGDGTGLGKMAVPFGTAAATGRMMRRETRDMVARSADLAERNKDAALKAFNDAVRDMDRASRSMFATRAAAGEASGATVRQQRDAMMLHAQGVLGVPGMTPRENLTALLRWLDDGTAESAARLRRTKMSRKQIERFRDLPDELLDYKRLPDHVREAVDVTRQTISGAQKDLVWSGFITEATEQAVRGRAAREGLGGEEGVSTLGRGGDGLRGEAAERRLQELTAAIDAGVKHVRGLTRPADRKPALAKLRQARRALRKAQTYKQVRTGVAVRELGRAERLLRELEVPDARVPAAARGDAQVVTNPEVAQWASDLERARNRVAELEAVVQPEIRRSAVSMIPTHREKVSVPGKRKAKLRFRSAENYYGRVEDQVRELAATHPRDARTLDEILADQARIGSPARLGGRKKALSDDQLNARAVAALRAEGIDMPKKPGRQPVPAINKNDGAAAARRQRLWEERVAGRGRYMELHRAKMEELRAADAAAMRPLTTQEITEGVAREMRSASRSKTELAAERIAGLVGYSVPLLEIIRRDRRVRLKEASAKEASHPSAVNKRAVQRAAKEAALADAAWRVGVARRLRGAEPEVRAQAIAQGILDKTAESTNPRVVAALVDERDALRREIQDLEQRLGLVDEVEPDVLFGFKAPSAVRDVEWRSARELRNENAQVSHGPSPMPASLKDVNTEIRRLEKKPRPLSEADAARLGELRAVRDRHRLGERMFRDDGPAAMLGQRIREERLERDAVRAGYQPEDITRRVGELYEEIARRESDLAVARTSEVGTRREVDQARAGIKRARKERALVKSPKKLNAEIGRLEKRVEDGTITEAEMARLMDLRELRSPDRSSPVPVQQEYRDVLPGIRDFVEQARIAAANNQSGNVFKLIDDVPDRSLAMFIPEVDVLPKVVETTARTEAALLRVGQEMRAVEDIMSAPGGLDEKAAKLAQRRVEGAWKEVEQAYFLEREARIEGIEITTGHRWADNPNAQHLQAQRLEDFAPAGRPDSVRVLHGRVSPRKPKKGHGTQRRSGDVDLANERMVDELVARAKVIEQHQPLVENIIHTFAARVDMDGKIIRGERVRQILTSDPGKFIPISAKSIDDLFTQAGRLEHGEWVNKATVDAVFRSDGERYVRNGEWVEGVNPRDVVLIPKEVADEWADAMSSPAAGLLKKYDNALSMWKAGVLALHPRWYVYNLIGNSLQFGIMSTFDVRSMLQLRKKANRDKVRRALGDVGHDVHRASLAKESRHSVSAVKANWFDRLTAAGFRFNDRIEGFLRDAAMWSATKKEMREAGKGTRRSTLEDMVSAIDDIDADSPIVLEAARTAKLFMGDYTRFSKFERNVMRRIFPFYSWFRVIGKLTLSLPFKHPLRTEMLSLLAQMSYHAMGEEEYLLEQMRPDYQRGGVSLPGGLVMRTSSSNPFATVAPWVEALGTMDKGRIAAELAEMTTPITQPFAEQWAGMQVLGGREFTSPDGVDGRVHVFGRGDMWFNPVTGRVEDAPAVRPSLLEGYSRSLVPFYSSVFRKGVSWGDRPYDTVGTPKVLAHRLSGGRLGDRDRIFMPPRDPATSPTMPVGPGGVVSILGTEAGVPLTRRNTQAELDRLLKDLDVITKALASQERRRQREAAARNGGG